jgi:hypothetical protein
MLTLTRRQPAMLGAATLAALSLGIRGATAGAPPSINADAEGLALYGYDPVAYMTDGKPTPGDPSITATHDGATYRFASAANRDAFIGDPPRYLPAYGGFCAYGVSQGYKVKIDPEAWTVVDGRLYLNYDKSVRSQWLEDTAGYIAKAESNWPDLKDGPRRD